VESKWKNYHITTFPGQSLSKTGLSLEEAMDLSRDRQIEEESSHACFGADSRRRYVMLSDNEENQVVPFSA
jgi:hypothetical protein